MIYLRIDDFPGTKPEEFYRHNLDNFKRFDELVRKHVPEYVLGIIPRHTTDDQLRWMSENPSIVAALHGVNHDERFPNEFRDHQTVDDIYKAITHAKGRLDPFVGPVRCYIPPHNVFDLKTCHALRKAGFKSIMGGPGSTVPNDQVLAMGFTYAFSSAPLSYGRSDELLQNNSIDYLAGKVASGNPVYLTLHWTWETNIGLHHLEDYLECLRGMFGKFGPDF